MKASIKVKPYAYLNHRKLQIKLQKKRIFCSKGKSSSQKDEENDDLNSSREVAVEDKENDEDNVDSDYDEEGEEEEEGEYIEENKEKMETEDGGQDESDGEEEDDREDDDDEEDEVIDDDNENEAESVPAERCIPHIYCTKLYAHIPPQR